MILPETKVCTKCHIEQPLSSFHKDFKGTDGSLGGGLVRAICKDCDKEYTTARYRNDPVYRKHKNEVAMRYYHNRMRLDPGCRRTRRVCSVCGIEKYASMFKYDRKGTYKTLVICRDCYYKEGVVR